VTSEPSRTARLQHLVDDLGTTLLEVIEAPGPLDAEVTGVTIFDPIDDLLVSPGDLLLGVGLAAEADITALIRQLSVPHAAGLVIKTPDAVSDALRDTVRSNEVPLLGLTRAASWFHVAVLLRSLLDRSALIGEAHLADSPAGDLFAFANAVSALVDAPVTIEDRSSRLLAFSGGQEEADRGRIETILGRHMPSSHCRMLEERGTFRDLYRSKRPIYVPGIDPDSLPRVAVAVRAGAEVLGSLWVVAKEPLSEERMQALAESAGLAALHMLHQRNAAGLSQQLCADLLESVLAGGPAASEAAVRLGLPHGPMCVLACQPVQQLGTASFESSIQRLTDALAVHLNAFHSGVVIARIGRLAYAVVSAVAAGGPQEISQRVRDVAASFVARIGSREPVAIGIGGPVQTPSGLPGARIEAERTLRVLRDVKEGGAKRFEDVYLETVLDRLGEVLDGDEAPPYGPIARLLDYDSRNSTELTASLRAYLEAFGDVAASAEAVHVHPNTFRYRLRRIREVSELDLGDPRARLAALVQLSTLRISL
jgi:hypothetical protein